MARSACPKMLCVMVRALYCMVGKCHRCRLPLDGISDLLIWIIPGSGAGKLSSPAMICVSVWCSKGGSCSKGVNIRELFGRLRAMS